MTAPPVVKDASTRPLTLHLRVGEPESLQLDQRPQPLNHATHVRYREIQVLQLQMWKQLSNISIDVCCGEVQLRQDKVEGCQA